MVKIYRMLRQGSVMLFLFVLLGGVRVQAQQASTAFPWPEGNRAAVSLSFDDARLSQVDVGTALFDRYGARVTFYVVPSRVEQRLEGWKQAVAGGHEIGNHSLTHPCSGNFPWIEENALEGYTLAQMRQELEATNQRIEALLGVTAETFAYPCGQTFVGRGRDTKSYVPVVAALFMAGRGWLDEGPFDPNYGDLAQVMGLEMDGKDFEEIRRLLEQAREQGYWVVFAGHEIGTSGRQTTRTTMLERLIPYLQDPANQYWLAPVVDVAAFIREQKGEGGP